MCSVLFDAVDILIFSASSPPYFRGYNLIPESQCNYNTQGPFSMLKIFVQFLAFFFHYIRIKEEFLPVFTLGVFQS